MRGLKDYIILYIKGLGIGAADVVPGGVSGGTIAFIVGVYEELLESIKSINLSAFKLLFSLKLGQFWKAINGSFFLFLIGGVLTAIFTLAKPMVHLVETYPVVMWSLFFGLIVASTYVISKQIERWGLMTALYIIVGLAIGYGVTSLTPSSTPETWWFIIFSGAVAICAMILPGISGAFVLLLMGKYTFIMNAVGSMQIGIILLFGVGAIIGIVAFSHVFSWLLKKHGAILIPIIAGFLIGSLNKVWPWKEMLESYTDSHGKLQPLIEKNISPAAYEILHNTDPLIWQAIASAVAGFLFIYIFEQLSSRLNKRDVKLGNDGK